MRSGHRWSIRDDIVAFYLYKFGTEDSKALGELSERLGIGPKAMRMRVGNYKALDGKGGLNHYSKQSKAVFDQYNDVKKEDLLKIANDNPFSKHSSSFSPS